MSSCANRSDGRWRRTFPLRLRLVVDGDGHFLRIISSVVQVSKHPAGQLVAFFLGRRRWNSRAVMRLGVCEYRALARSALMRLCWRLEDSLCVYELLTWDAGVGSFPLSCFLRCQDAERTSRACEARLRAPAPFGYANLVRWVSRRAGSALDSPLLSGNVS